MVEIEGAASEGAVFVEELESTSRTERYSAATNRKLKDEEHCNA